MTKGAADSTLVAKYNDLDSVKALFEANKGEVAPTLGLGLGSGLGLGFEGNKGEVAPPQG